MYNDIQALWKYLYYVNLKEVIYENAILFYDRIDALDKYDFQCTGRSDQ